MPLTLRPLRLASALLMTFSLVIFAASALAAPKAKSKSAFAAPAAKKTAPARKSPSTVRRPPLAEDDAPGPRLTDATFFSLLDLERPDLAAVKAAVATADWPAAKHALAEHMRTRTTPHWTFDGRKPGRSKRSRNGTAERALTHRVSSIGIDWQFGDKIDWSFNPTTAPDSKWPANHEWTWQLSRHSAWLSLSQAFRDTGDEKYAAEFVSELKSWVHDCPVPVVRASNVPYSRWRTIEGGIRTGSVWPDVFFGFLGAKSFDDEALTLMLKSFAEHGRYLTQFYTHGNWLTMEANGLYHVGALFPEFKDAKLWRETAIGRLDRELGIQVYPDGAQTELAPSYHGVALDNFLGPVNLVALTGCQLPADYLAKIEKMFAYYLDVMEPNRTMPPLNDSGAGSVMGFLNRGAQLFPARQDFLWIATDGAQGKAPAYTSHEFPYAGQFIMRGGWERDALWLCMEGGPYGFGHQHEDKLGVILTAFGKPLLVEGGVYTYDASDWRRYVLSSRAHNLIMIDGKDQARRRSPSASWVVQKPLPHLWESSDEIDHAAATYDEGWGPSGALLARHTRNVWFFKKLGCFVIADDLEPTDAQEHTYEALFHLNAPEAEANGLRVTTKAEGPNLTLLNIGADGVRIVKGQKTPEVQGWLPDGSQGYGGVRPIPTAIYSKKVTGKVTLVTVLYPTPAGKACPVREVTVSGETLTLKMGDGEKTVSLKRGVF